MTREEAIVYLKRADVTVGKEIQTKTAEALDLAIKALEQETVSKESYDHEYFLRKELEMKIARLEQQEPVIDKIRAEVETEKLEDSPNFCIKAHNNAVDRVLKIIDKYKAETEE